MISLIAATVFFVGIHVVISGTRLRDRIVGRLGERPYLGLFSLLSLIAIFWMAGAYAHAPVVTLWPRVEALVPVTMVLVFAGFLIGVPGLLMRSPTAVGGTEGGAPLEARGVLRITRHPFLWGVTLWALGHLIVNGDVASLIFFLGFLVLALAGPFMIDGKRRRLVGPRWLGFEAATSRVPFEAIMAGRNSLRLSEIGWWRIAVAVVAFGVVFWLHPVVFGAIPYPLW